MFVLAAAKGANDVSKGVATLIGSGVTRYRTAIVWGALTTLVGALVSGAFAGRITKLFTSGIVSAKPTPAFTLGRDLRHGRLGSDRDVSPGASGRRWQEEGTT